MGQTAKTHSLKYEKIVEKYSTILQERKIIAADIVELNPSFDNGSTAALAAKMISTIIAMNNAE